MRLELQSELFNALNSAHFISRTSMLRFRGVRIDATIHPNRQIQLGVRLAF